MTEITYQNNIPSHYEERLRSIVEKIREDEALVKKIQDRNFWQIIFSNNSRDLAKAGMAQNELIRDLHRTIQEIIKLRAADSENSVKIMDCVEAIQKEIAKIVPELRDNIEFLFKNAVKTKKEFELVKVDIAERRSLDGLLVDIKEIGQKQQEYSNIDLLFLICESIRDYIIGISLPNNGKRKIIAMIKECNFGEIKGEELNSVQTEIAELFNDPWFQQNATWGIWHQFIFGQQTMAGDKCFSMAEAISGIIDAVTIQESDRYSDFRDKLVRILDEFLDKGIDVYGQYAPELSAIRKRLHENQFEIALIGEFQGGKSTTFNMLCDGREISPRGLNGGGIKTSAAVITVQNIDGNETRNGLTEWAEIEWLNVDEIRKRIGDALMLQEKNIPTACEDYFEQKISAAWKEKPTGDELEILRIATLQFRLLAGKNLDRITADKIVAIDKFQSLVKFPKNWETRWADGMNADFSEEEILFTIVDSVLVRIHSDSLAKIGCRITDCPGLFVSRWDTERAEKVMMRANAIWYLLNGEKELGQSDLHALQRISDFRLKEKCFFSVNQKDNRKKSENILRVDTAKLKAMNFYPDCIFIYDAFLAFRMAQIKLASKNITRMEIECLAEEARCNIEELNDDPKKCEAALKKMVLKHLYNLDEDNWAEKLAEEKTISPDLALQLTCISGVNDIFSAIEKLIISRKARSILIDEGAEKCMKVLNALDDNWKQQEDGAKKELDKLQMEVKQAREKLNEFTEKWREEFRFLTIESLDDGLANDFFRDNEAEIVKTIKERAVDICIKEWRGRHISSSAVNRETERKISKCFVELIGSEINNYLSNIQDNEKFKKEIHTPFQNRLIKMKREWDDMKKYSYLFLSLETIEPDSSTDFDFDAFNAKLSGSIRTPSYFAEFLKDFLTLRARRLAGSTPTKKIQKFFKKEKPVEKAYQAFRGSKENQQQIADALGVFRRKYLQKLTECLNGMQEDLDKNIRAQEEAVNKSNKEKAEIAENAKEVREHIIVPYKEKLSSFKQEVCRFYDAR